MKKIKLLLWSAVVATLSACSSSSPEALEGSWQLTHIDGKPAAMGVVLQLNLKVIHQQILKSQPRCL